MVFRDGGDVDAPVTLLSDGTRRRRLGRRPRLCAASAVTGAARKWYEYGGMVGIPPPLDTDAEDVAWALQTAEALWKRNERVDAVVWLRRAAQAAGEADDDDRALALARDAAELADYLTRNPAPAATRSPPSSKAPTAAEAVDDLLRAARDGESVDEARRRGTARRRGGRRVARRGHEEIDRIPLESERLDEPSTVPPPRVAVADPVPSAAAFASERPTSPYGGAEEAEPEEGAGRERLRGGEFSTRGLTKTRCSAQPRPTPECWIHGPTQTRRPKCATRTVPKGPRKAPLDRDEVVTSAPLVSRTRAGRGGGKRRREADGARAAPRGSLACRSPERLPDDARAAFAQRLSYATSARNEEIGGFALALIVEGSLDLAATIVDAIARRLETGAIVRSRGTIDHVAPVRLVAASGPARVAIWEERSVEEAFRTCPWVEHELRAASDRIHAEVGVTMGPLGARLDPVLRAGVIAKLSLRVLGELEVFATRGEPIPGILVVGAGELELVGDDGAPQAAPLRAGDFLFPNEVLRAAPAPNTVRAAKGGALILIAPRGAAHELLVTCPPLLEIFAGG